MTHAWDVIVIGAGGSQAQAMLEASARAGSLERWLGVDIRWSPETEARAQSWGMKTETADVLSDASVLRKLLSKGRTVVNLAGPYYRTGATVLDAAIESGTDYMDICDDADVVLDMNSRLAAAEAAGVRALIGMGSSPGTTNVLIRAAVDYLGEVEDVDIQWSVDVSDMTDAAARHFWHCFNLIEPDGTVHPVPGWSEMQRKAVEFPGSVGSQEVVKLAHPEPLTLLQNLPVERSSNYGTITPIDALVTAWSLAHAVDGERGSEDNDKLQVITQNAVDVFRRYRETRPESPRVGSGLLIDVHTDGNGIRFASGAETEMAEATGVPAAAGLRLMIDGQTPEAGVFAPEQLKPSEFFAALGQVSRGGGGLKVYRLVDGAQGDRIRMRDLLANEMAVAK